MSFSLSTHLLSRHVNLFLHKVWLDEESSVATFPLYNLSGMMVGYQMYRPGASKERKNDPREGRYFTRKSEGTLAVWGLESFHLSKDVLFVVEGIFDAARLTNLGHPAIATLSNKPTPDLLNFLQCLPRKIIAVCDNDSAGKSLAAFGDVAVYTKEKDLGDSSDEDVKFLLSSIA